MIPNLKNWMRWQRGRGLSERTIKNRRETVTRIARDSGVTVEQLNSEHVADWFDRELHPVTRATYHSHIKAWGRWQAINGVTDISAILGPVRRVRSQPKPITTEHLRRALDYPLHRRARAMVMLAAYQGLRIHEVAKVRGEDVDLVNQTLHVVGKGGSDELLPLHPRILKIANDWPRVGWWFPSYSREGLPVRPKSVGDVIARALRRAGSRASAHQLRHWFATELVRSGADIFTTQTLMRHKTPATTAAYVKVADDAAKLALRRLPDAA